MAGRKIPEEQRREGLLRAAFAVAAREGLAGVTARAVAAEAGVSSGLVFFHFHTVDALLAALLEWLLAHTFVAAELPPAHAAARPAAARMLAAVRRDLDALPRARRRVELFFDYWVRGTRDPAVRGTIRRALDRYRLAFVPLAAAVVAEAPPGRYGPDAETGDGRAGHGGGHLVEGCALRVCSTPPGSTSTRRWPRSRALVRAPRRARRLCPSPALAVPGTASDPEPGRSPSGV
jgi:AcrR family transcriptional regulator